MHLEVQWNLSCTCTQTAVVVKRGREKEREKKGGGEGEEGGGEGGGRWSDARKLDTTATALVLPLLPLIAQNRQKDPNPSKATSHPATHTSWYM